MELGHFFNNKYLSDAEIQSGIEKMTEDRNSLFNVLAATGAGYNPADMTETARQFSDLDKIYHFAKKLDNLLKDLQELKKIMDDDDPEEREDLHILYMEYTKDYTKAAMQLFRMLQEKGYVSEEVLDSTDMDILNFIEYAGPEYAWRLGINIGIDTKEARDHIEKLLKKGLLEKVQGTMLEGYHREKDWVKHMNHTYYRLSRNGRLFLRELRQGDRAT